MGEEPPPLIGALSSRNDWRDLACSGGLPIEPAVIPFVGNRHARRDVWTEIERSLELRGVAYLAAGQVEIEWITIEVGLEVDFCREAAARMAERLILLPPFAPAAET